MAWRALDPNAVEEKRIPDEPGALTFKLGFWPPAIDATIRPKLKACSAFWIGEMPKLDPEALSKQNRYDYDVLRESARYSCRGWSGDAPAATFEEVEIDGRKHKILSAASLDFLYANDLLFTVGTAAVCSNVLTEEQKKTSGEQSGSGSSSPPTPAADATTPSLPKTTGISPADSANPATG